MNATEHSGQNQKTDFSLKIQNDLRGSWCLFCRRKLTVAFGKKYLFHISREHTRQTVSHCLSKQEFSVLSLKQIHIFKNKFHIQ